MNLVNREFVTATMKGECNAEGEAVFDYLPRKCAATSKVLGPHDHKSIQIVLPKVGQFT